MTYKCGFCEKEINHRGVCNGDRQAISECRTRLWDKTMDSWDMYKYKAKIVRVVDGDTIDVDLDLGLNVTIKGQRLRLLGVNTPEMRGESRPEGIIATKLVNDYVAAHGKDVTVKTYKDKKGKYGRWLAEILWDNINLNHELILEGYGE